MNFRKIFNTLLFSLLLISSFAIEAIENSPNEQQTSSLKKYLLPVNHPLQRKLAKLFHDPSMFNSPNKLEAEDFSVLARVHRGLMVASHPTIKKHLFKKFINSVSQEEQIQNFIRRIEGARALRTFIKENQLHYIVVPQKWLYQLPEQFSDPVTHAPTYILIVEKMDILSGGKDPTGAVAQKYFKIRKKVLKELCLVLYNFHGLDSVLHNVPFTKDGKIAFIDTERWQSIRRGFMPHIIPFLDEKRQKYVQTRLAKLRSIWNNEDI
jgi:hypothetical protein